MRIYEDLRSLQARINIIQSLAVVLVLALAAQFWTLQVLRARYFQGQAENNRMRAVRLAAPRGNLLDRNGHVLVENRAAFDVMLTPEHAENLEDTLGRIGRLLNVEPALIRDRITRRGPAFRSVVVKADATVEDVAAIEARRLEHRETSVEVVPLRSYPLGRAAAQILGYVSEVNDRQMQMPAFQGVEPGTVVGQAGLELQYNKFLMGKDGMRRLVVNSRGIEVGEAEMVPPVEGPPVSLTLDATLQRAMEDAMAGQDGSAVALDPRTGEVLAMTSSPAYDPNDFAGGIDPQDWGRLITDPSKPLMNRVIQGTYAPGSTFKVMMGLAGLEAGIVTPSTTFFCPGSLAIYGTVFRCHKKSGHGSVDLRHALQVSCDVYFYNLGVRLEIDRISKYAHMMGLGDLTGIDLPHESSGTMPDTAWKRRVQKQPWYAGETVSVAIGQGAVSVTALQMAQMTAVIANGGKLVHPHLVKAINGEPVAIQPPTDLHFKPENVDVVREGMEMVVGPGGTAQRAALQGIRVAAKTGTAQIVGSRKGESKDRAKLPNAWVIAFAPAEKPTIAIAVLIEHGEHGGLSAGPVAGKILARFFGVPSASPFDIGPIEPEEPVEPTPETPTRADQ
jgi:penicillin-binding protein 2